MEDRIVDAVGAGDAEFFDADVGSLPRCMGDSIATNMFLLGYAWQKGLVPLTAEALARAIELNGAAVEANKAALPGAGVRPAIRPASLRWPSRNRRCRSSRRLSAHVWTR